MPCHTYLAEAVHLRTHRVDQRHNGLFHEVLTHAKEVPRNISTSLRLHSIAKNVEHMGDNVTNIAEQMIHSVSDMLHGNTRPKGNLAVADDM